jgi:ligand-binding SRPBCC domain-containing protein
LVQRNSGNVRSARVLGTDGSDVAYTAKFEQWIPLPLERVFEFFGNPENLPKIMPPWMKVRVDDARFVMPTDALAGGKFAGSGSVVTVSFRPVPFLPFRIRSQANIVGFAMNHFFEDSHSDMLFKSWHHRHEFVGVLRSGTNGTIVRDVITYELALGSLSAIANALFVSHQMRSTFSFRQRAVERLLLQ